VVTSISLLLPADRPPDTLLIQHSVLESPVCSRTSTPFSVFLLGKNISSV
jgi:hypothetical protein